MKNQYFADVNDYRKYGLLRCITDFTQMNIGILWLLTPDDGRTDGEFRGYLRDPRKWDRYDKDLHRSLARMLEPEVRRDVRHAATWGLVPKATYFDQIFPDGAVARDGVFKAACSELSDCPLVFLDPDNGVEVKSVPYGRKHSSKYVYWKEMAALFERGHSLLVYQHYRRTERRAFEAALAKEFCHRLAGSKVAVFTTPHVAFFLVLNCQHILRLPRVISGVEGRWRGQFAHWLP